MKILNCPSEVKMKKKIILDKKVCFKCGMEKPLNEFYAHPQMGDGHLNKCKECNKRDSIDQYNLRIQSVDFILSERERTRERYHRLGYGEIYKETPEQSKARSQQYRRDHRDKWTAHMAVGHAIRSGKLVKQPCKVCGAGKVEAHHEDYSKPLDVVWLCVRHHNDRHIEIRKEQLLKKKQAA